jgi:hypothetical protein
MLLPGPAAGQAANATAPADSFPHLEHQGLFPLCAGCHVGIPEGRVVDAYPEPESCAGCHDGVERSRVAWTPAPLPVSLLDFSHPTHAVAVADDPGSDVELECASCHVREGGGRLEVVPLSAATCLECHGDPAEAHYEDITDCSSCHRPVAEAETGLAMIAASLAHADAPRPTSHLADDFLAAHAPDPSAAANQCATCHVQERCTSCHVDTDRPALDAVPGAPTAWMLPAMPADYPTPASHLQHGFDESHGVAIDTSDNCSTCHTQDDCSTCHIRPLPPVILELPRRVEPPLADTPVLVRAGGPAPGVGLVLPSPRSHESPFFMTAHPVLAGTNPETCGSCHEQSFCTDCHEQPGETGFHPDGFVVRHAPAASSAFQDCSSCHSTQQFCRQCHVDLGMGSTGRLGGAFHDAEPLFLLRHGTAARRDLEACASCHTQNDCRQCHAQTGAFGVSPHGPGFDATRANEINPWICTACHIGPVGSALGGGGDE